MSTPSSARAGHRRALLYVPPALILALAFVPPASSPVAARGEEERRNPAVFSDYRRPAEYGVVVVENVMVPMRDGARLATDLYFPAKNGQIAAGRFPAILDRTPYDKVPRASAVNNPKYFAERGYVFVFQDSRGHGKSEGEFSIYTNEGRDGYDTIEWIAKQPWSDGKVGTSGYSYDAATQNSLARETPPHLTSMFIGHGTANYRNDGAGDNGAFALSHNLIYTIGHAQRDRIARENPAVMARLEDAEAHQLEWMRQPLFKHLQLLEDVPLAKQWYKAWIDHPDYDDYWKQNGYNFEGFYDRYPDVPVYFLGSWYDFFIKGTIRNYLGLSAIHKTPKLLTVAGSAHGPGRGAQRVQNDVDMGPDVAYNWDRIRLRWFDETLMGRRTGVFDEPRVKLFVMGGAEGSQRTPAGRLNHGGRWHSFDRWPVPQAKPTNYYLHADGGLSTEPPAAGAGPSGFTFDPANPVPQLGGNYSTPSVWGPRDQRCSTAIWPCTNDLPLSSRADVLVFQTPALDRDVSIAGPLTVKLWAASSAVDTDFTVKLVDEYPPSVEYPHGYAMILQDSIVRARYRNSLEKAELMEPGRVYEFTIDMWATANLFKKGHRIRLDVSSSNFPKYDVNPNTGGPIGYDTRRIVANNIVYHDRDHPSHIILPVLQSPATTSSAPAPAADRSSRHKEDR